MEQNIEWQLLPTTATPEMASAAFAGKIEPQSCQIQQVNRERMAATYELMVAAAPKPPVDEVALAARERDAAEAAALQSWLVGNARIARPVDESGLMAWALAALVKVTAERDALFGEGRYTSISKGGEYALMGTIYGAGGSKGLVGRAYRDATSGKMYFREPEDFVQRIKPIAMEQAQ